MAHDEGQEREEHEKKHVAKVKREVENWGQATFCQVLCQLKGGWGRSPTARVQRGESATARCASTGHQSGRPPSSSGISPFLSGISSHLSARGSNIAIRRSHDIHALTHCSSTPFN